MRMHNKKRNFKTQIKETANELEKIPEDSLLRSKAAATVMEEETTPAKLLLLFVKTIRELGLIGLLVYFGISQGYFGQTRTSYDESTH